MPARINHICVVLQNPMTEIGRIWMMNVIAEVDSGQVTEVLKLDTDSGAERAGGWDELTRESLRGNELMIVHCGPVAATTINGPTFVFAPLVAGWSITISFEQAAVERLRMSGSRLLGRIAGATFEAFPEAALAWGDELDLFEVGERFSARTSDDLRELCEAWRRDWRCRGTMLIRSSGAEQQASSPVV